MRIRSVLVIVWCVCCSETTWAQNAYEFPQQPGLQDYYYVDTYKTDVGPGEELVRPERSFFKKLFKNWGKSSNIGCIQCCQNTAGYNGGAAGDGAAVKVTDDYANGNGYYEEEEPYDSGYAPPFNPEELPAGHHGHIYVPLPHPHKVMSHLHNYLNRPFRRGYGGKVGPAGNYPPKESAAGIKADLPSPKGDPGDVYQEPAPTPAEPAPVDSAPVEPVPVEQAPVEPTPEEPAPVEPVYTEKPDYPSEEKYDQKEGEASKITDPKKYQKEETVTPAPVTSQVIQPIVPVIAPPVYVYPPQYYTPPAAPNTAYAHPFLYPAASSPSYPAPTLQYSAPPAPAPAPVQYSAPPIQYTAPLQATYSYSPPVPTYAPTIPPAPPVQNNPPPAVVYPRPEPVYFPPVSTYTPPNPSATPVQNNPPPAVVYPTSEPVYSPPAASYPQVTPSQPELVATYTPPASPLLYSLLPPSPLSDLVDEPPLPCPFSNPSDCSYFKKTYSTSLTYMLPQSQSPPSPPSYYNTLTMPCYQNDQLMRSCPELFTDYQQSLQASAVARPC